MLAVFQSVHIFEDYLGLSCSTLQHESDPFNDFLRVVANNHREALGCQVLEILVNEVAKVKFESDLVSVQFIKLPIVSISYSIVMKFL